MVLSWDWNIISQRVDTDELQLFQEFQRNDFAKVHCLLTLKLVSVWAVLFEED